MTNSSTTASTPAASTIGTEKWIERDRARVWHGFTQMATYADNHPVVVARGSGRYLFDTEGRRYLDAISSMWVVTLGHAIPELNDALKDQADSIAHSTLLGNGSAPLIELSELLAELVPVDGARFLYASDGASAVEQAIKIAFQSWHNRGITTRKYFAALDGAYHGDTIGALSVGDDNLFSAVFAPLRFPVLRAPDPASLAQLVDAHAHELAGVIVEPLVQAAAGMKLNDDEGLRILERACRIAGVPLIVDEIATGFGRTGTLFACQQAGVRPDILCLGKGMTGGYLPMSATVVSAEIADTFLGADLSAKTFYHGHSYGGNALAAAVALRHADLLAQWEVLPNVTARAAQLAAGLGEIGARHAAVAGVRARGLFGAVELDMAVVPDGAARRACAEAARRGVLLRSIGPAITTVPILTSSAEEIDTIVSTIAACLETATA